jgi:hypothetical protein
MPQPRTLTEYVRRHWDALRQRPLTPAEQQFQAALQVDADRIERAREALLKRDQDDAHRV